MKKIYLSFSILLLALSAFCQDIDYTLRQGWSQADSSWTSNLRSAYIYDSGNLQMIFSEYMYPDSINWSPAGRYINEYNMDQTLSEKRSELWNTDLNFWENEIKTNYTYTSEGSILTEKSAKWNNEAWLPWWKYVNDYNSNNVLVERISSNWDTLSNDWLLSLKDHYTYDADGKLTHTLVERFLDSQWFYYHELNYSYTNFGKIAEKAGPVDTASNGSLSGSRTRYFYDSDENLVTELEESIYAPTQNWISLFQYNSIYNADGSRQTRTRQWNISVDDVPLWANFARLAYFYLNPSFVQKPESFSFAVFPNPTSDEFHIRIDESLEPIFYKVLNVEGRTLLSGSLHSINKSVSTGGLASGVYLIEVRTGDKTGYTRIVKK